jgi:hypothetical protein
MMPAFGAHRPRSGLVVVTSGHLVDEPGRSPPRFPAELEPAIASRIGQLFEDWSIGEGDVVLSGGARGADILFAECGLDRGAQVRLLLALPPEQFVERSVALSKQRWEERFYHLLKHCQVSVLPEGGEATESPFERVNTWMLEEARRLCPPGRLVAALVWDERPSSATGGTSGMADLLRREGVPTVVIPLSSGSVPTRLTMLLEDDGIA